MPAHKGYDTPKEARFRALIRKMLDDGIKPTPKAIKERQGEDKFVIDDPRPHAGRSFSGGMAWIRIEEFEKDGWTSDDRGIWHPPPQKIVWVDEGMSSDPDVLYDEHGKLKQ